MQTDKVWPKATSQEIDALIAEQVQPPYCVSDTARLQLAPLFDELIERRKQDSITLNDGETIPSVAVVDRAAEELV